jgi:mono/diheme cytochrome c family protein
MLRIVSRLHYLPLISLLLTCWGCSRLGGATQSHEQQVAAGRALYDDNGCATCHGPEGHGDGPVSKILHISPRDFRDAAGFVNGYDLERIARTIYTGLDSENQSMPSYSHLSDNDRQLLAVFIMSLRNDDPQKEKSNEHQ